MAWAPSFRALLALERQYLVQCGTSVRRPPDGGLGRQLIWRTRGLGRQLSLARFQTGACFRFQIGAGVPYVRASVSEFRGLVRPPLQAVCGSCDL